MRPGHQTDSKGNEPINAVHPSVISAHLRALDVELIVKANKDLSYPLSSPHNNGLHVIVQDKKAAVITQFNTADVESETELIAAVNDFFNSNDQYVMITSASVGDTFAYNTTVYNQTAIDNKSYDCWDEDLETLEDHADQVVSVTLNDELRWQVMEKH